MTFFHNFEKMGLSKNEHDCVLDSDQCAYDYSVLVYGFDRLQNQTKIGAVAKFSKGLSVSGYRYFDSAPSN